MMSSGQRHGSGMCSIWSWRSLSDVSLGLTCVAIAVAISLSWSVSHSHLSESGPAAQVTARSLAAVLEYRSSQPPELIAVRGFCSSNSGYNGVYQREGYTASGHAWYSKGVGQSEAFLFYDADPNGKGETRGKWIFRSTAHHFNASRTSDLDADGQDISGAYLETSGELPAPPASQKWSVRCVAVADARTWLTIDIVTFAPRFTAPRWLQVTSGCDEGIDGKYELVESTRASQAARYQKGSGKESFVLFYNPDPEKGQWEFKKGSSSRNIKAFFSTPVPGKAPPISQIWMTKCVAGSWSNQKFDIEEFEEASPFTKIGPASKDLSSWVQAFCALVALILPGGAIAVQVRMGGDQPPLYVMLCYRCCPHRTANFSCCCIHFKKYFFVCRAGDHFAPNSDKNPDSADCKTCLSQAAAERERLLRQSEQQA